MPLHLAQLKKITEQNAVIIKLLQQIASEKEPKPVVRKGAVK